VLCAGGGCGTRLYFVELGLTSASSSSSRERSSASASSSRVGDFLVVIDGTLDCCEDGGGCDSCEGIGADGFAGVELFAGGVEELQSQPIFTGSMRIDRGLAQLE
jgi:hypothetical protein